MTEYAPICLHPPCTKPVWHDTQLCYAHRHLRVVQTPLGQTAFRSGGPIDLAPRLARERTVALPPNSARIPGFPYATVEDVRAYAAWADGAAPRPDGAEVLDRFPIELLELSGTEMRGDEVGIYDADGDLYTTVAGPGGNLYTEEQTEYGWSRAYRTTTGHLFVVNEEQRYQVVRLDYGRLNEATGRVSRRG